MVNRSYSNISDMGRAMLTAIAGVFYVHGRQTRVVFKDNLISVGCTDADPEALRELLRRYDAWKSGSREFVLQP